MESENVRLVRATYEAWNSRDVDRILAVTPPDFEFRVNAGLPGVPDVVRGHEGVREMLEEWYLGPWEEGLEMRLDHIHDLGDGRVLALITFHGIGRDSGIEVELRYAHLGTVRDGLVADVEGFADWEKAKRAVGIEERA